MFDGGTNPPDLGDPFGTRQPYARAHLGRVCNGNEICLDRSNRDIERHWVRQGGHLCISPPHSRSIACQRKMVSLFCGHQRLDHQPGSNHPHAGAMYPVCQAMGSQSSWNVQSCSTNRSCRLFPRKYVCFLFFSFFFFFVLQGNGAGFKA